MSALIVKLGDICNIQSGGTPSRGKSEFWEGGCIPWVKISDMHCKFLSQTEEYITDAGLAASSAKMFSRGTILYTIFATLGETCILNIDATTNQAIAGISVKHEFAAEIAVEYLYYFLMSIKEHVMRVGRGVAQNNINLRILRNVNIVLPSLERQNEIVRRLSDVESMLSLRQRQAEKLDELVKARFVEMFGDPVRNCQGFPVRTIGELTTEVKYGTSKPAVEGGKYPYLRMNNLTIDGKIDLHDLKQIDVDTSEFEKCVVRKGDVLFNRTNSAELVGKTAYYGLDEEMIIAGYIIRVRVNNLILPQYLSFYMNMPFMKQRIRSMAKGAVNQANINSKELKSIKVIVPPLEVQGKVVEYEERIDREKDRIQRSAALLETLKRSLMQQYFG